MKYYSIRVINAVDWRMAVEAVKAQYFDEQDPLCDKIVTKEQLIKELTKRNTNNEYYQVCQDLVNELRNCGMEETAEYYADKLDIITNGRNE